MVENPVHSSFQVDMIISYNSSFVNNFKNIL
nr:MAG TPA: Non-structural protein 1 virus, RNA-binding domain, RNA.0A [Caudoviricetes sp.]